jgi:hypothetical protein
MFNTTLPIIIVKSYIVIKERISHYKFIVIIDIDSN